MSTTLPLLLFLFTTLPHFSHANPLCTPSSCGVIRNISYPFRLKGDSRHCGHLKLTCHHNLTSISLNSRNFYVKAIDYQNSTIRVADPIPNNDNICSFPISSFPISSTYDLTDDSHYRYRIPYSTPINLMSCPNPLKNSSLFTNISTNCSRINDRYSYIKIGSMKASEVPHLCGLDLIVMTSWEFHDLKNVSLSQIHQSLLYGFELTLCNDCGPYSFWWGKNHRISLFNISNDFVFKGQRPRWSRPRWSRLVGHHSVGHHSEFSLVTATLVTADPLPGHHSVGHHSESAPNALVGHGEFVARPPLRAVWALNESTN